MQNILFSGLFTAQVDGNRNSIAHHNFHRVLAPACLSLATFGCQRFSGFLIHRVNPGRAWRRIECALAPTPRLP